MTDQSHIDCSQGFQCHLNPHSYILDTVNNSIILQETEMPRVQNLEQRDKHISDVKDKDIPRTTPIPGVATLPA
jgi:hypothetical protein